MNNSRVQYYDTLKFIAILGVIFLHCMILKERIIFHGFNLSNLNEIARFSVPIFLMVSGALLLNKNEPITLFYKKRFIRICYPLIFFIIISCIFNSYPNLFTAFWYCWMILGTYLAIPFIRKIINNSSMKEIEYLIIIFIFSSIFYQIMYSINLEFSLDLNFFITPITYLVIGFYLSKKEFSISPKKLILISSLIFIITTILKIIYGDYFDIYPKINMISYLDFSILQILQASSLFLICRFIYSDNNGVLTNIKNILEYNFIKKLILSFSRASYGMYLVHMIFLNSYFRLIFKGLKNSNLKIFIFSIFVFIFLTIISWIIIIILSRIPIINKFSGYY